MATRKKKALRALQMTDIAQKVGINNPLLGPAIMAVTAMQVATEVLLGMLVRMQKPKALKPAKSAKPQKRRPTSRGARTSRS